MSENSEEERFGTTGLHWQYLDIISYGRKHMSKSFAQKSTLELLSIRVPFHRRPNDCLKDEWDLWRVAHLNQSSLRRKQAAKSNHLIYKLTKILPCKSRAEQWRFWRQFTSRHIMQSQREHSTFPRQCDSRYLLYRFRGTLGMSAWVIHDLSVSDVESS